MTFQNLSNLYEHLLQDMYYAENRVTQVLPQMKEKAEDEEIKQAFENHLNDTKDQITKLEKVFEVTGLTKKRETCEAIEGIIKENNEIVDKSDDAKVRDAALIAAAQKVEHYEITSYGTLCAMAEKLGHDEAKKYLQEILQQEKETDVKLTKLAQKRDVAEPVS